MIKTQQWSPDTCSCQILQQFDYAVTPPALVDEAILVACAAHATPASVTNENQKKNRLHQLIAEETGEGIDGVSWTLASVSATRELTISLLLRNLTASERTRIQNFAGILGVTVLEIGTNFVRVRIE